MALREYLCKISAGGGDYPQKIAVFGIHPHSIGDCVIILRALYALKILYPQSFLSLLSYGNLPFSLLKYVKFIDEILNIEESKDYKMRGFDVVLLVIKHNSLDYILEAKTIQSKRLLTTFSKSLLLLQKGIWFIPKVQRVLNLYWKQKHIISDGILNLVRAINKKHFDRNIHKIDFTQAEIPRGAENIAFVESALERLGYKKYQKLIGICPFGKNTKANASNFALKDWIKIVEDLAQRIPTSLFLFMDYPKSGAQFPKFAQENIKIFTNNQDLLNLVELTSRLDCLLSVDTGNVHIADNLRIPTLELIRDFLKHKWAGGSYGGICKCVCLPTNWQECKNDYRDSFMREALEMILNWDSITFKASPYTPFCFQ